MLPKRSLPRPTEAELSILRVLWHQGPSTVRQVHHALGEHTGYTTILKLMQIMTDKGLLTRNEKERSHVYQARLPQEQTQRQLLDHLLQRAFNGSAKKLILQALSSRKTSARELAEIRELLEQMEKEAR